MRKIWDSSKTAADGVVDGTCGGQVVADRFLQDHTRRVIDEVVGGQMRRDRAEQARRAGQVEHPDLAGIGRQQCGQRVPVGGVGEIDARVVQTGEEAIERLIVEGVLRDESAQLAPHFVAVAGHVEAGARRGDDAGICGELAITVAQVEGGKKLADGEIAGSAENNEVTRCHGVRGRHGSPDMCRVCRDER